VHEIFAPLDHIPLHIRGGSIITTQVPAMNTELSRQNPFGLIIAPNVGNTNITFSLYCDDGEEIGKIIIQKYLLFIFLVIFYIFFLCRSNWKSFNYQFQL
jgi:alpha-glucosidase (family GH31 glycosyl hydrolase)